MSDVLGCDAEPSNPLYTPLKCSLGCFVLNIRYKTLQASVDPIGAELSRLSINGTELIWHGDQSHWGGRAPILFPIVGELKNGQTEHNGKTYNMPRHGIARKAVFDCIEQSDSTITMRLKADATTLAAYPWLFELQVSFKATASGLDICYTVFNRDKTEMLFTLGSHPAFALNIDQEHSFEDYAIAFNKHETLETYALNEKGLLATESKPFKSDNNTIVLSETLFNQDALVFRDIQSNRISLTCKGKTVLSVQTGDAPHLGIWSKPGAPFVCIEPWLGTADFVNSDGQLANKPDLQTLAPGENFSHSISIDLH